MKKKLRNIKCETKLKYHQIIKKFYDQMNYKRQSNTFVFDEDLFSKKMQKVH